MCEKDQSCSELIALANLLSWSYIPVAKSQEKHERLAGINTVLHIFSCTINDRLLLFHVTIVTTLPYGIDCSSNAGQVLSLCT